VIIEPVVTSEDDFKRFITTVYVDMLRKDDERAARELGSATAKSTPVVKTAESDSALRKSDSTESILGVAAVGSAEDPGGG